MNKKLFLWIGSGVIVIFVLFFLWTMLVGPIFTKADRLTEREAAAIAESRYAGKAIRISEENQAFMIELQRDTGLYEVMLNGETGKVLSLEKISENAEAGTGKTSEENKEKKVLNENEIKALVEQKISGEMESIERLADGERISYRVIIKEAQTKTIVTVDGVTGEILTQEQVHGGEGSRRLTEEEAVAIALGVVNGTIDDVDIENINGIAYYFIEVETADGRDANVEINAITGEVRSLSWDD